MLILLILANIKSTKPNVSAKAVVNFGGLSLITEAGATSAFRASPESEVLCFLVFEYMSAKVVKRKKIHPSPQKASALLHQHTDLILFYSILIHCILYFYMIISCFFHFIYFSFLCYVLFYMWNVLFLQFCTFLSSIKRNLVYCTFFSLLQIMFINIQWCGTVDTHILKAVK